MLASANVFHLFMNELSSLRGGRLAFALSVSGSFDRFLFGHTYPQMQY